MKVVCFNHAFDINSKDPFQIVYDPVTRSLGTHKEEIEKTVQSIAKEVTGDIFIFLSGGIDSEIVAAEFFDASIKFTAVSFEYENGANKHDVAYAIDFCKNKNIPHKIIPLNIQEFVSNKIPQYIEQGYIALRIYRYLQIYMLEVAEELGGHAILGGREGEFRYVNGTICTGNGPWFNTGIDYCRRNNKQHYPAFYLHNPEIFASYLQSPLITCMLSTPGYFNKLPTGLSLEKMIEYKRLYPWLVLRAKYNGFENLKPLWNSFIDTMGSKYPVHCEDYYMPVSTIKQQLGI